jgi:hypothetical protein
VSRSRSFQNCCAQSVWYGLSERGTLLVVFVSEIFTEKHTLHSDRRTR